MAQMKYHLVPVLILSMALSAAVQRARPQDEVSDRPQIDVESYSIDARISPEERKLDARVEIRFRQLDRRNYAVFDLDRRLRVAGAFAGTSAVRYRQFDLDSTVEVDLSGQQEAEPVVRLEYSGILSPEESRRDPILARISPDNTFLLYESKWYPTNGLYQDKANVRLKITIPPEWSIAADLDRVSPGTTGEMSYASASPSFWGTVIAGRYQSAVVKSEKLEITVQTLKAPSDIAAPIGDAIGRMLDFYSETFGPPPGSSFRVVEVEGANWASRWALGALLLQSSQFRKDFDTWTLARTVARQWFPLKITMKDPSGDGWLADGMTVFASLLYFEKLLSPAEAQDYVERTLIKALSYEGTTSIRQAGGFEKDSREYQSLVLYKGAFVLRMLRWTVGDEKFRQIVAEIVQNFQSKPLSTEAFIEVSSRVAGEDLGYFFDQWLNSSGVPEFTQEFTVFRAKEGYKIMGQIKQDLDLFKMPLELQVQTDGEPEYRRVVVVGPSSDFDITTERKPKAVVIDPFRKVMRMSSNLRVAVHISRGEELADQGQYNDAINEYQKAVDLDKLSSLALFRMGEALFEQGNLQAAANVLRDALNGDLKPKWVEVWAYLNLGKIYDIRGQRDRAVTEYQKALNTGDDSYGAQAEAQKYINEPFRRSGRTTIG